MAQDCFDLGVAIEVAECRQRPFALNRQVHIAGGTHRAAIHQIAPPCAIRVPEEDVVLAIAVEVAKARKLPMGIGFEFHRAALRLDRRTPVHWVVVPPAIDIAQKHVVVAVAVQVTDGARCPVQCRFRG